MRYKEPSAESVLAATLATQTGMRSPYRAAFDAMELAAIGRAARNLATRRCNGIERWNDKAGMRLAEWNDTDEARAERVAARLTSKAIAILTHYGATLESVSGDPRGLCLKFKLANGESMGC